MFVWGSAQPLKSCFSNDAVYEQSGMNLPERVTESGVLPPLTELSSVGFLIREDCGDELPSGFLLFTLSNKRSYCEAGDMKAHEPHAFPQMHVAALNSVI